jgi:glycosyltransferase involved in cell wall biosynthesis
MARFSGLLFIDPEYYAKRMMPLISVILPVFNGARYLSEAVASILGQSFGDFELIAVNDGSTDNSLEILKEYAKQDRRIRVISRVNTGIAGALNDGIAAAAGQFLARMDADDVNLPRRFEKQVSYLIEHPECVLLGSRAMLTDPYGVPQYESKHKPAHEQIEADLLQGDGWAVLHPAAMMRAEAVRAIGGYRSQWVPIEDLDLFLRLTEIGRAANLPDILLHYRQHPGSANHTRFAEQEEKKRMLLREVFARRGVIVPPDWALPVARPMPLVEEIRIWGWRAINRGRISAARRHAMSLLKMSPMSRESWRLVYCALRGR